jgi:hypothetical protein
MDRTEGRTAPKGAGIPPGSPIFSENTFQRGIDALTRSAHDNSRIAYTIDAKRDKDGAWKLVLCFLHYKIMASASVN